VEVEALGGGGGGGGAGNAGGQWSRLCGGGLAVSTVSSGGVRQEQRLQNRAKQTRPDAAEQSRPEATEQSKAEQRKAEKRKHSRPGPLAISNPSAGLWHWHTGSGTGQCRTTMHPIPMDQGARE
jgi:hypothetical protein